MGLSGPVAVVILVSALLAQASTLLAANTSADTQVEQSREQWQRRHEAMQAQRFTLDSSAWNATRSELNLTLNNTGLVTMNASRLDVLLDGARAASASVSARLVAGVATDVWGPGQLLNLTVSAGSKPSDAAVASPWGLLAAKRGV